MNPKLTAKIISYIFIPPVLNFFIFLSLAIKIELPENKMAVIVTAFLFGLFLPVITFVILRKKGKIVNDDATIKEERTVPYLYGIFFSITATLILYYITANKFAVLLWLAYFFNSIVLIIVNKYWKISAHAMGAGIPLGASYFICGKFSYVFLIILLLVAWARFELKVHTIPQIITGAITGLTLTFLIMNYL